MLLAESLPDISGVPSDFIKNLLLCAGFGIMIFLQWRQGQSHKREISGSVETSPKKEHADKADLDELTESLKDFREEVTAQFRNSQTAGENRVVAITQDINEQMSHLSINLGELTKLITKALVDNASQGEAINGLKASNNLHQQEIAAIRKRIDDLINRPIQRKP